MSVNCRLSFLQSTFHLVVTRVYSKSKSCFTALTVRLHCWKHTCRRRTCHPPGSSARTAKQHETRHILRIYSPPPFAISKFVCLLLSFCSSYVPSHAAAATPVYSQLSRNRPMTHASQTRSSMSVTSQRSTFLRH